jgi:hypothetical protein
MGLNAVMLASRFQTHTDRAEWTQQELAAPVSSYFKSEVEHGQPGSQSQGPACHELDAWEQ